MQWLWPDGQSGASAADRIPWTHVKAMRTNTCDCCQRHQLPPPGDACELLRSDACELLASHTCFHLGPHRGFTSRCVLMYVMWLQPRDDDDPFIVLTETKFSRDACLCSSLGPRASKRARKHPPFSPHGRGARSKQFDQQSSWSCTKVQELF
jgi:hypothetical protein